MNEELIIKKAIRYYGSEKQKVQAMEELSELQQAICKDLNGKTDRENIIEELTDVYIMLEQLEVIYQIDAADLMKEKQYKLVRLNGRMETE